MKRFVLLFLPVFLLLNTLSAQDGTALKPNIILVMADDLGMGDVGYTGFNPYVETPALDRMARSGIRFDRFYSQAPVCSPTRGSVMTGRHPFRYGIFEANVGCLRVEETTLPELLSEEGYHTGHFGKWHLGLINDTCHIKGMCPADPFDFGYDYFFGTHHSIETFNPNVHIVEGGPDSLNLDSTYIRNGIVVKELLYGDDSKVIMDEAIDFISGNKTENFFSTIWFHTPHKPVIGPPELKEYYNNKYPGELSENQLDYYAAITAMDMQIGRLRDSLESWGIAENTMLWFCSDNGPTGVGESGIFKGAKRHLYEGGVRVPGLLVWPEKINGSRIEKAIATTSDYLPTILDAIGSDQQTLQPIDGVSLMPVIENLVERRSSPLCFQSHGSMVCMNEDYKLMQAGYSGSINLGIETGLIDNEEEWMLFDMHNDSIESQNIIAQHPEIADSLSKILMLWMDTVYLSFMGSDYEGAYTPTQSYRFSGGVSGQSTEIVSECRLGGIYINGLLLDGFDPDVYSYEFALLDEQVPQVLAIPDATNAIVDTVRLPKNVSGTLEERTAIIEVLAEDQSKAVYSIVFSQVLKEQNAYLREAVINDVSYPEFSSYISNYYVVLPFGTTEVPVVYGIPYTDDAIMETLQARQITNAKEIKRTAIIKVLSGNGEDSLQYSFVFSVGTPSSNTFLSDLMINAQSLEGFSPCQCTYYVEVPDSTAEYNIEGIPCDPYSIVTKDTIYTYKDIPEPSSGNIEITAANGIAKWSYEIVLIPVSDTADPIDTTSNMKFRSTTNIGLSVYPNPCSGLLQIDTDLEDYTARIFDISGKIIHEETNSSEIEVEGLDNGLYILTLNERKGRRVRKVKFFKL